MPSLRERKEDIPALAAHFIRDFDSKSRKESHRHFRQSANCLDGLHLAGERTGAGEYDRTECAVGKGNDHLMTFKCRSLLLTLNQVLLNTDR